MRPSGEVQKSSVSVVILTMNAEKTIADLLEGLQRQTIKPVEILVMDSQSEDRTPEICSGYEGVRVFPVLRSKFNHGGTRDIAFRRTCGEYVLFLTHDVEPCDTCLIENLLAALAQDERIAAAYGRQVPRQDAWLMERLVRGYNYPEQSHVRSAEDIPRHGIKTFFLSDVCAMYRRNVYFDVGGFEKDVTTNEDMFFAAAAIRRGYSIAYAADARVMHSHNFTMRQQYRRNFLQGYEIERRRELLAANSQESEGMKLVREVSKELLSKGHFLSWTRFGLDCCARYAGSLMGRRHARKHKQR